MSEQRYTQYVAAATSDAYTITSMAVADKSLALRQVLEHQAGNQIKSIILMYLYITIEDGMPNVDAGAVEYTVAQALDETGIEDADALAAANTASDAPTTLLVPAPEPASEPDPDEELAECYLAIADGVPTPIVTNLFADSPAKALLPVEQDPEYENGINEPMLISIKGPRHIIDSMCNLTVDAWFDRAGNYVDDDPEDEDKLTAEQEIEAKAEAAGQIEEEDEDEEPEETGTGSLANFALPFFN